MNIIESVDIIGFWGGNKNITITFDRDANFIIGKNGTGKTTVINLIASALKGDIKTLYSIKFESIKITLKEPSVNRKPIIEIKKSINNDNNSVEIIYEIRLKTTEEPIRYIVEGPYEERLYRDLRYRNRNLTEKMTRLESILDELIEVNFLSVHRGTFNRFSRDEEFTTIIDKKASDLSTKFSSYFSLLTTKINEKSKSFQEFVFLTLLDPLSSHGIISSIDDENKKYH